MLTPTVPTAYTPVQGTNSWTDIPMGRIVGKKLWWQDGSEFTQYLLSKHNLMVLNPYLPFIWDTDISGVFWKKGHRDWQAAGANLHRYFEFQKVRWQDRNVILHSHGLQVGLYACAQGLELRNVISIGGPVRKDMMKVAEVARKRIGYWLAISDPKDKTQLSGGLFDGALGYVSKHPLADANDSIPGIAHSHVLYNPAFFHHWADHNWPDFLKLPSTLEAA
jgi:hypothetical protein